MAKDLKLNIKNAQIAQALKKFNKKPAIAKKAKPKQKEADETQPTTIKRKARILPPEEKAPSTPKKEEETKAPIEAKEKVSKTLTTPKDKLKEPIAPEKTEETKEKKHPKTESLKKKP